MEKIRKILYSEMSTFFAHEISFYNLNTHPPKIFPVPTFFNGIALTVQSYIGLHRNWVYRDFRFLQIPPPHTRQDFIYTEKC